MKTNINTYLVMLLLVPMAVFSQNTLSITGKVLDEKDNPLPFATVLLGNGSGVITDLEGHFSATISEEELATELTASFVGYQESSILWQKEAVPKPIIFRLTPGIDLPVVEVTYISGNRCILTSCIFCVAKEDFFPKIVKSPPVLPEASFVVITTYPNPFVSTLNVEMEVPAPSPYLFQLYNGGGQLVKAEQMQLAAGLQTLQLGLGQQHLPEGAYSLRISTSGGEVHTQQLVKVSP